MPQAYTEDQLFEQHAIGLFAEYQTVPRVKSKWFKTGLQEVDILRLCFLAPIH